MATGKHKDMQGEGNYDAAKQEKLNRQFAIHNRKT